MNYKYVNGNPWQRFLPDCTIRALCIGLNMSYQEVCRKLQIKYRLGYGMEKNQGACSPQKIMNNFKSYFIKAEIDEIYNDVFTGKDVDVSGMNVENGFSVEETAEMLPGGLYIFILRPTEEERKHGEGDWHTTLVNTANKTVFDIFDCSDENMVYGWMAINMSKRLSNDDPKSRFQELSQIDKGFLWGDETPPHMKRNEKWEKLQKYIADPNNKGKLKGGIIQWIISTQRRFGEIED